MSVAVIGVVAGVASAGAAAYSSYSSGKAQEDAANSRVPSKSLVAAAAGTVPNAARYVPVDFNKAQLDAIQGNTDALPLATALANRTNRSITASALQRISRLVPGYQAAIQKYGLAASDLLSGRLPFNDVQGIIGDRSAKTGSIGIAGTAGPATLRDLGVSELGAIQTGGSILKDMVGMAEAVSPIGRYATPQQMFVSPADRINQELQQHQLIQQSDQNANNLAAEGDPAARLALGLQTSGVSGGYQGASPLGSGISAGISGLASAALGGAGGGAGGSGGIISGLLSRSSSSSPSSSGFYPTQSAAASAYGASSTYTPSVSYWDGGGTPGASTGWYLQNYTG